MRRGPQPSVHRAAILSPISSCVTTARWQLLSCGLSTDFVEILNFNRHVFFNVLLPSFTSSRPIVNYGSPYRAGVKIRGPKPMVEAVYLLGLVLFYLISSDRLRTLSAWFGYVPCCTSLWVQHGIDVLDRICKHRMIEPMQISWPSHDENEAISSSAGDPSIKWTSSSWGV